ncbi:MAG TPA: hypothetical protein VF646_15665 [Cytophagales bacterium]|jgi:hypothetical protein
MISSSSYIAIGLFAASAGGYVIGRNGIRTSSRMRNRDWQTASFGKANEEKQHFYGSPGV